MNKLILALFLISSTTIFSQEVNPGGVTGTRVWLKTVFNEENGEYVWRDFSCDTIQVNHQVNYDAPSDNEVININFNQSLKISNKLTSEILLTKSNLSQATIIGVFGKRNNFVYNYHRWSISYSW